MKDSEWIADLLQASYIPDRAQRELWELVSYRKSLTQNRLQKMPEGANIKLSGIVAYIDGKSAHNILDTILSGTGIDSAKYDEMYSKKVIVHNLKASKKQIIDDLNGVIFPLQRKMMRELLVHMDELDAHIQHLDDDIDGHMKQDEKQDVNAILPVTGLGVKSDKAVISVIWTDMGRFPTDEHISSWAGLCPEDNESARKQRSGKSGKGTACCVPH